MPKEGKGTVQTRWGDSASTPYRVGSAAILCRSSDGTAGRSNVNETLVTKGYNQSGKAHLTVGSLNSPNANSVHSADGVFARKETT